MSGEDSIRSFPVPDLGEGLQEVTVTCWSVAVGDDVEINQTLCSVETAKAEVEIPSPYAGRIVELGGAEGDVLKVGAELVRIDTGPTAVAQPNGEGAVPTLVGVGAGPDVRPVHGVHARMAEKMTLSHKEIPTAKASVEVICAELLRLRDRFVSAAPEITPFALTLRLLVIALKHNVILNSTWVDSGEGPQVHVHRGVHLGFGAATERGLLVPVVTDAQDKNTRELASRVAELITGAREGTLTPAELRGSTFTVSNFGALGVDDGVPVINHPEAAILGLGAIKPRPVVVGGEVVARPTMTLTCVFDHRVVDGAQVAQFMCELRDLIESPETALLDL